MHPAKIILVYDKECPVCNNYCQMLRVRESVGELILVNAREDCAIVREIIENGFDLDQGMALKIDEQYYFGADTIHALALIGSESGVFNKINYWIFRSKLRSRILYPVLKFGRNILLKFIGRSKIHNLHNE